MRTSVPLSVLDLAPVGSGSTASRALRDTVTLARRAEQLRYRRFWLAEHHGMPSIASSSPEILIEHVASRTDRLRVGAGGIMLPNHAPLRIAEAFHTLEALHPGRIDLGIGRAPGTDPSTFSALRPFDPEHFPRQLQELFSLSRGDFPEDHPFRGVRVVPEDVRLPPVWILGSSGASASMAGSLGTGYGFAAHFSSKSPLPALDAYCEAFRPSEEFARPHALLALSVVCAETGEHARHLARSMDLIWVRLRKGVHLPLPTPEEAKAYPYTPQEQVIVENRRALTIAGDPESVVARIAAAVAEAGADEVIVSSMIHDPGARRRSYELLAESWAGVATGT